MSSSLSTSSRWFVQRNKEKLSLDDFRISITLSTSPLEQRYHALQEAYAPFTSTRGVLPFQCRKAIRQLLALNTEIHQCSQFLRDTQTMPVIIMALRYQLLDKLHHLKERVDKLLSYLYDMNSSQHSASLRNYVRELFENLLPLIADIPQQVSFLLDEASFLERRLAASFRGS